jgi:hypothetical protein
MTEMKMVFIRDSDLGLYASALTILNLLIHIFLPVKQCFIKIFLKKNQD